MGIIMMALEIIATVLVLWGVWRISLLDVRGQYAMAAAQVAWGAFALIEGHWWLAGQSAAALPGFQVHPALDPQPPQGEEVSERFKPGKAFGGGLAVVDTKRKGRAVCIVLPDPTKPDAAQKLAEIFSRVLNSMDEKAGNNSHE